MVRNLLVAGSLLLLVVGCKKQNTDPPTQETGCLLKSEKINDKPYRTYEYLPGSELYRIVQYETTPTNRVEKRYSFEYDQQNRLSAFRETALLAPLINYEYALHYRNDNKIDTIRQFRIFNSGPRLIETYSLEYDDKGRLTRYKWGNNYWRYEYDDLNNVTKWFTKIPALAPIEILVAEYGNYDGKRNVYFYSEPARLINLVNGGGSGNQNPGSFKFYEASLTPSQTGIVTYLYNQEDLPTEASVSLFSKSGSPSTLVYKFEYECL